MNVLIADDDATCRVALNALMTRWSYCTTQVYDGRAAWNVLSQAAQPMIVLADWMMPEMNGPELCCKVRSELKKVQHYIILVTAKADRTEIVKGLESGADDYVTKPFDQNELRARVRVGDRMLSMQETLRNQEKLQGVVEMAGAVCHELNQPLQSILGYAELLQLDLPADDVRVRWLGNMKSEVQRLGDITRKIMNITQYRTKCYMGGIKTIVDLH